MELEITLRRTLRVFWEYAWRVAGFGFIVGLLVELLGFLLGASYERVQELVTVTALIVALPIMYLSLWSILGKKFGKFRLVLVESEVSKPHSSGEQVK